MDRMHLPARRHGPVKGSQGPVRQIPVLGDDPQLAADAEREAGPDRILRACEVVGHEHAQPRVQ